MKYFTGRNILRALLWGTAFFCVMGVFAFMAGVVYVVRVTEDLPDYQQLAEYRPPIMSRVHAGDGLLIAEYATEQRVFVPIENIQPMVIEAFLSAEDKNFYDHGGIDYMGMIRGVSRSVLQIISGKGGPLQSGSTITQQVAKNFLLTSEQRVDRKVREIVIARRMERAFTKDEILELYLNEIYLGNRAYGIAAAALNYFDKSLDELELHEAAYLAALPKAPSNYHPTRRTAAAIGRRNWILSRMVINGVVSDDVAQQAMALPLETADRLSGETYLAAEYFVEQVRRNLFKRYGQEELNSGGLSIRTTIDTKMQLAARRALRDGLETYDRRHGYRGPLATLETFENWPDQLGQIDKPKDLDEGWRTAVVLELSDNEVQIGFEDQSRGRIPLYALRWAREPGRNEDTFPIRGPAITRVQDVLQIGDIVLVEGLVPEDAPEETVEEDHYGLRQVPAVNGAILAIDPFTGRVLTMVGGYSFSQNQFNRAVQARRQPGSAFKPFVYAAALDNGYTPASLILDAPFVASGGTEVRFYRPQNYSEVFYGPSTLRRGLELSRNVMTVRLAQELGMRPIVQYGESFGIYDDLAPTLAMSLGAGETRLMDLVGAYSALINGGRLVEPNIIDRVQDRTGQTIYVSDTRACATCDLEWSEDEDVLEPDIEVLGNQVIDPVTAYQIVHMLEGAVQRGTATALKSLGRPLGGKTGTTNDFRDAWFVGFSPDLVVGIYVGFDTPLPLGAGEAGGRVAAPIAHDFFDPVLANYPIAPFRVPDGVYLVPIQRETGEPGVIGRPGVILEAFRPGTEPQRGATAAQETLSFGAGALGPDGLRLGDNEELEDDEEDDDDILGDLY